VSFVACADGMPFLYSRRQKSLISGSQLTGEILSRALCSRYIERSWLLGGENPLKQKIRAPMFLHVNFQTFVGAWRRVVN
jgi:hypothetical protein